MRPEVTAAIAALEAHRVEIGHRRIVDLFAEDPKRFLSMTLPAGV